MTDVSVVIPSHDRQESVTRLVRALLSDDERDLSLEVIVVLDGCRDGSEEVLQGVDVREGARLVVHSQANRGPAAARNAGLHLADGQVVLFLDDDMLPLGDLVGAHWRAYGGNEIGAVLGRIVPTAAPHVPTLIADMDRTFFQRRHDRLSSPDAPVTAWDVFTGNLSARRRDLMRVHGFDESLRGLGCEDMDLGYRLLRENVTIKYVPNAAAVHHLTINGRQWRRRTSQEGRAQVGLARKQPALKQALDIARLDHTDWRHVVAAQVAIQFPGLAVFARESGLLLAPLAQRYWSHAVLNRLITLSWTLSFWSGVRSMFPTAAAVRRWCSIRCTILTYHRVSDNPNPALADYAVGTRAFAQQIWLLSMLGFTVLSLDELLTAFENGLSVRRGVVLSFDDGYLDTITHAAPVLARYGYPATVFIVPSLVGTRAQWDTGFGGEPAPLATWEQLRALRTNGWEIGLHSLSHRDLAALPQAEVEKELVEGKVILEEHLDAPVTTTAYPYGEYSELVVRCARAAGFRGAVTVVDAVATQLSPRHELPRFMLLREDTLLDFFMLVTLGRRPTRGLKRRLHGAMRRLSRRPGPGT